MEKIWFKSKKKVSTRVFVEMNRGHIWIESVPDKGCDVKFTLPRYENTEFGAS